MCYSKEVSAIAGTLMISGVAYSWWNYVRYNLNDHLKQTYTYILIGYLCLALHQYGDSLSIATGSTWIYKLGLIISISAIYFYMYALEQLSGLYFGSKVFLFLISLCSISILLSDFTFENAGFWVRGDYQLAFRAWVGLWLGLYIYWNFCILYFREFNESDVNKKLLIYFGFYTINISFILYLLYASYSWIIQGGTAMDSISINNLSRGFDYVSDSPSMWCTFSVIQLFFIPRLFHLMHKQYDTSARIVISTVPQVAKITLLIMSILTLLFIVFIFPYVLDAALKMVTT